MTSERYLQRAVAIVLILGCGLASGQSYSGGTGEPDDPYLIASAQDLTDLGQSPDDYDKHFRLTADIDLSAHTFDRAVIAPDAEISGWIHPQGPSFAGVFDGNDHAVRHLHIEGRDYLGLFGSLTSRAMVRNLRIEDCSIQGNDCLGSLVAWSAGTLSNCYGHAVMEGNYTVGGLVGHNDYEGRMLNCHSVGEIRAKWDYIGGLVAVNSGTLLDCHSEATVASPDGFCLGGLVGSSLGVVSNCYATGAVTAGALRLGGLIGISQGGHVLNSYSTGPVTGYDEIGGLIGSSADGSVQNCCCTGAVAAYDKAGGLIGAGNSSVSNCYSSGEVTGQKNVGGLVGLGYGGGAVSSFWDTETSGQPSSDGGVGLTTAEMQQAQVYLDAGWDFVGESRNGTAEIWQSPAAGGYPRLALFDGYKPVSLQGRGTASEPFRVASAQDLGAVRSRPLACYRLTTDLDLSGITWDTAPIPWFNGCFDGNGHVIRHLRIQGTGPLGLFGLLDADSVVTNLGLESVLVAGEGDNVGSLAGCSGGLLANCYGNGTITGDNDVGGLVGYLSGLALNCYSLGSVQGDYYVGGLIGAHYGSVSNCYTTAAITRESGGDRTGTLPGGLIGFNFGSVLQSFWDTEVSGVASGPYGVGLTTSEMQEKATYLNAGWDFVDEGANGTVEAWQMPPSGGYPVLSVFRGYEAITPEGQGTSTEPFLVTSAQELGSVAHRPAACYRLEADIDLSGMTWSAAVVPWFAGRFDGNGHAIRNLDIQGTGLLGLFGFLDAEAVIVDLGLEGGSIHGTNRYVGTLAGHSDGTVIGCHSTAPVSGDRNGVGGLVGFNGRGSISDSLASGAVTGDGWVGGLTGFNWGLVSDCSSDAEVNGGDSTGGLVGYNEGTVFNCASSGPVTGGAEVGGLVGDNSGDVFSSRGAGATIGHNKQVGGLVGNNADGSVRNCYSTGAVAGGGAVGGLIGDNTYGRVQDCYSAGVVMGEYGLGGLVGEASVGRVERSFWDMESSGVEYSSGGAALTTAEMRDPEWIGLQGWAGNSNWVLNPHQDYPRLAWEGTEGQPIPEPIINWIIGEGTSERPYDIETTGQLLTIAKASLLWQKNLVLANDLDLGQIVWSKAIISNFSGVFDGNGHAIRNLRMSGGSLLGLVGRLNEGGTIANLAMTNINIAGVGERIGGLVGYNVGGTVSHCQSTGRISGGWIIGGLAGYNDYGNIFDCNSACRVTGYSSIGGLLGGNHGNVANCQTFEGTSADGADVVGGLVGGNYNRVSNCYSLGEVTAEARGDAGGLVGYNIGIVSACHSAATIRGGHTAGGLVGYNQHYNASVTNCYSTGAVLPTNGWFVGGLIGRNQDGSVSDCYSTGLVIATNAGHVGGLVASSSADSIARCFWDVETSGQTTSDGGTGLTTAQMWDIDTFLEAGWDFLGETDNGVEDLWWIDDGRDYPHLWWELAEEESE